jgi:hypothetical protein
MHTNLWAKEDSGKVVDECKLYDSVAIFLEYLRQGKQQYTGCQKRTQPIQSV